MPGSDLGSRVALRLERVGISAADEDVRLLALYIEFLARWNRRINLTAFDLDLPTDEALDRLIVEPLVAARYVRPEDRLVVDLGSGGGSPAIPLKIVAPSLRVVLVEARTRKSVFLREAVRALNLADVSVETRRFDAAWRPNDLIGAVDVVTMRAIRADADVWTGIEALLRPLGRVFWFVDSRKESKADTIEAPIGWSQSGPTVRDDSRFLTILTKSAVRP